MNHDRTEQRDSHKPIESPNDRPSLAICKDETARILSELLSERVFEQKQIIQRKYMNYDGLEIVSSGPKAYKDANPSTALNPLAVLQELFELLEDYSPTWYTEETRDRTVTALKQWA